MSQEARPTLSWLRAERVPLTRRKDRLYLKGAKTTASTEPDFLGQRRPPDEWLKTLGAAMPGLAHNWSLWSNEKHRQERAVYGYTGYWAPPWLMLRIHLCADCEKRWYVAHHSVKRCAACERQHRQDHVRASNARMIARRAEQRAAARADMVCAYCGKQMNGRRLRRYCCAAHRQAASRERPNELFCGK